MVLSPFPVQSQLLYLRVFPSTGGAKMPTAVHLRKPKVHGVIGSLVVLLLLFAQAASASAASAKRGLPIITFESGARSVSARPSMFEMVRAANPSLYTDDRQYHAFYDSRNGKVLFQDVDGVTVKPDARARQFVIVWHDGVATDWRYIDSALAN